LQHIGCAGLRYFDDAHGRLSLWGKSRLYGSAGCGAAQN
jgi:hypothetical protein